MDMANISLTKIDGLILDKDGTLFDFHSTWGAWASGLIDTLAGRRGALREALAEAMDFDLAAGRFRPTSPIIAGTNRQAAECMAQVLGERDIPRLENLLTRHAARAPLAPPVPLAPLLEGLRGRGLALGVVTNDSAEAADAQLRRAGIKEQFDFVAGFDSGHGAKPAPGPLLAFASCMGLPPERVAMVGDSTHDLIAGRAAGMVTLAVLTGPARRDELAPLADAVLAHIGEIPAWLGR